MEETFKIGNVNAYIIKTITPIFFPILINYFWNKCKHICNKSDCRMLVHILYQRNLLLSCGYIDFSLGKMMKYDNVREQKSD